MYFLFTLFVVVVMIHIKDSVLQLMFCFCQNDIILSSLRNSGKVAVMASEEDDTPTWIKDDGPYVVVVDPLDGSRNIDASIPTGTIFGIYSRLVELDHLPVEEKAELNSLQRGNRLVASGYVLYSSATILCVTLGSGTHAFTLDHSTGEFVLTHPNIKIPTRGKNGFETDPLQLGMGVLFSVGFCFGYFGFPFFQYYCSVIYKSWFGFGLVISV